MSSTQRLERSPRHLYLAWLIALLGVCPSALPARAQVAPTDAAQRARGAVQRGEVLFEAHNYDAALPEFSRAYELLEGDARQYLVLHNIAVCHERTFRYDLALDYYERYLREGGPQARDRVAVERVLETLRGLLARLAIEVNVPADVWVDARQLGRAPGSFVIPAGKHVVELRASMRETSRHEVQLEPGTQAHLSVSLEHLSQFDGLPSGFFWASVGLTGVALGAAAYFGASALDLHAQAEHRAHQSPFLNTDEDERAIKQQAFLADLGYASAALFGATSVVLYLVTDWGRSAEPSKSALQVRGGVTRSSVQLGLSGAY